MAKLTKEQYERRKENAHYRHERNREITTLTDEQHTGLALLCSARHEFHSTDWSDFYNDQSGGQDRAWSYIYNEAGSTTYTQEIPGAEFMRIIDEHNLPELDLSELAGDSSYHPLLSDIELGIETDMNKQEYYDYACDYYSDFKSRINRAIESYLSQIDREHGTNYCPTGAHRNADI